MNSPCYVGFKEAITLFIQNYKNFNGRSTRSEYWYVVLATIVINLALGTLSGFLGIFKIVYVLFSLAIIVPGFACAIRRMHDVGKSGYYLLLALIPIAGFYVIFLLASPSTESNEWGDPASY